MHTKIIKAAFLLILAFAFAKPMLAQSTFYDVSQIREVRLYFTEPNWDEILDSLFEAGLQERMIGRVCIDGTCLDSAGIRYKGYSSVNVNYVKNPFNIDLDYIRPAQEYMGVTKLKLGNVIHDPSFVREVLAYEIARKYMPASLANYAKVYVNDTLIGLYTNIESVNKPFAARHFGSDGNAFFKGDPAVLEYPLGSNANLQYYNADSASYYAYYSLESDAGWDQLVRLTDILNNNTSLLDTILNIDRTLWMHAFNYAIVNLDSYIAYAQNYYIYQDDYGRFNPVLWDMNMSFGSFRNSDASTNAVNGLTINQAKNLNPLGLLTFAARPRPLVTKLLSQPTYKRMFMAHLRTIIQENFQTEWYYTRAQQLQAIISSDVQADTNRFYSYQQFLDNIDTTVTSSLSYPGLKDFMTARSTYLSNYAGFQGAPVIDSIQTDNSMPDPGAWVWFNARISGHDSCFMAYRYNAGGPFSKVSMYDDGLHHDGLANDSIFGVQVQMNGSLFQYYFYAENSTSGVFSPVRAEYEYYSLSPVTSGQNIVINEFMAKNQTYAMDNYYNFDDWIEIYNNSGADISMKDVYLSDNILSLKKWAFPDTIIPGHGYMIVWADEQGWQSGLHASFKLADTGESIYMTYDGLTLIDSVRFGTQTMDWSWGRYPNGVGEFGLMRPSIAAVNNTTSVEGNEAAASFFTAFPNPATDFLTCRWVSDGYLSIRLFTMQGQEVYRADYDSPNGGEIRIETGQLPRGVYLITGTNSVRQVVQKIVLK